MNPVEIVKAVETAWQQSYGELARGSFMRLIATGSLTGAQYASFLRETYHNAACNPRLGSLFHAHADCDRPGLEARFLKHNASEIGHHNLALADLAALGLDPAEAKRSRPLPTTEALAGFAAFQIAHRNPKAYLGYLYHLESVATTGGPAFMSHLSNIGIPDKALTFLMEHAEADTAHMNLNREYLAGFIRTPEDLEAVIYGVQGACRLYGGMLQGILEAAGRPDQDWSLMGVPAQVAG